MPFWRRNLLKVKEKMTSTTAKKQTVKTTIPAEFHPANILALAIDHHLRPAENILYSPDGNLLQKFLCIAVSSVVRGWERHFPEELRTFANYNDLCLIRDLIHQHISQEMNQITAEIQLSGRGDTITYLRAAIGRYNLHQYTANEISYEEFQRLEGLRITADIDVKDPETGSTREQEFRHFFAENLICLLETIYPNMKSVEVVVRGMKAEIAREHGAARADSAAEAA